MRPFQRAEYVPEESSVEGLMKMFSILPAQAQALHDLMKQDEVYINDVYQVALRRIEGGMVHLSVKRRDRQPIHDWRDLQEIKNTLVGAECEAVELYPAESRRVDSANQYHLWAFSDPAYRVPFGFRERLVSDKSFGKSVNRKLEET